MRVPPEVLKCVAFIGEVTHEDQAGAYGDLHATGFFVSVPARHFPGLLFTYFVTAKHVATDLKDRKVYILVNSTSGGTTFLTSYNPYWWLHPADKTADLAVLQVAPQDDVDILRVGIDTFLTPEDIANDDAGPGDEVFMTGLFTYAPGDKRNLPIVRHGNLAMFPEEQIQTELGFADAYLVEARSIGGLSGSPAFIRRTITIGAKLLDGSECNMSGAGRFKLLGLMHGHWDIKESDLNKTAMVHDSKRGVNLGIGIVVPAIKILETINQEGLVKSRELAEEDLGKKLKNVPSTDSAVKKESEPQFTQQDFDTALKKASRKVKQ